MDIALESLYQQIFDTALIAIGVIDLDGKFILVNSTWCKQLGYTQAEAKTLTLDDITLNDDKDDSNANIIRLIQSEVDSLHKMRRYRRKDGSSFWANLIVSTISDGDDKNVAILSILNDIDKQIKSEISLKEINQALESSNNKLHLANNEIHKKNEELQLAYFKLGELARTDILTGLPNRRQLDEQLEIECRRAQRTKREFCICICDIDDFKSFNDSYGHDVGDIVLKELSGIFRKSIRTTDFVGRWGGEEFLFILPETPNDGALVLMERVRQNVMNHIIDQNGVVLKLTITLGYSTFFADSVLVDVIKHADLALYAGKKSGKNLAVSYRKELETIHSVQI
jgi:diguanylate cyclase (GGDEF)-like protein/PAS domain S-box-containing protein